MQPTAPLRYPFYLTKRSKLALYTWDLGNLCKRNYPNNKETLFTFSQCSKRANHLAVFQFQYEPLLFNYNLQIRYAEKRAKINKSNK